MHDEAQDGLEVMPMERDLGLLRHVHMPAVPRALAVPQSFQSFVPIGRMECVNTCSKAGGVKG